MDKIIATHTADTTKKILGVGSFAINTIVSQYAMKAINDDYYLRFIDDPIVFVESLSQEAIENILQQLSAISTRYYIQSFISCMKYMIDFETKAGESFMTYGDKKQKIIMSLIYLVSYPEIETDLYKKLLSLISQCTNQEILSIKKIMIHIGLVWEKEDLDDPILAQFLTKAQYAENGLREVASI